MPELGGARHTDLLKRASKALLKQVEETRRRYAVEVEGLKAEVELLGREKRAHQRDTEAAAVTAAAAKKAAADATDELEALSSQLKVLREAIEDTQRQRALEQRQVEGQRADMRSLMHEELLQQKQRLDAEQEAARGAIRKARAGKA